MLFRSFQPGQLNLIGDNPRVPELFLPLERNTRTLALLNAAASRIGAQPAGGGGPTYSPTIVINVKDNATAYEASQMMQAEWQWQMRAAQ